MHRSIRGLGCAGVAGMLAAAALAPSIRQTQAAPAAQSAIGFGAAAIYPQGGSIATGAMAALPQMGRTKIMLYIANLQPMQIYHEYLQAGSCAGPGGIIYALPPTQADADGSININTTINAAGIPAQGLAVTAQLAPAGSPRIACGNAHRVSTVIKINPLKISVVPTAQGYAMITRTMGIRDMTSSGPMSLGTEVVVFAQNLEPSTVHEEHIHAGACNADMAGQVRYPLTDIETDPTGQGVAATFINGTPSLFGSMVNVHAADLRPAACGNFG